MLAANKWLFRCNYFIHLQNYCYLTFQQKWGTEKEQYIELNKLADCQCPKKCYLQIVYTIVGMNIMSSHFWTVVIVNDKEQDGIFAQILSIDFLNWQCQIHLFMGQINFVKFNRLEMCWILSKTIPDVYVWTYKHLDSLQMNIELRETVWLFLGTCA